MIWRTDERLEWLPQDIPEGIHGQNRQHSQTGLPYYKLTCGEQRCTYRTNQEASNQKTLWIIGIHLALQPFHTENDSELVILVIITKQDTKTAYNCLFNIYNGDNTNFPLGWDMHFFPTDRRCIINMSQFLLHHRIEPTGVQPWESDLWDIIIIHRVLIRIAGLRLHILNEKSSWHGVKMSQNK